MTASSLIRTPLLTTLIITGITAATHAETLFLDTFENDTLAKNSSLGGGMKSLSNNTSSWKDTGNASISTAGGTAILLSEKTFKSETGFILTVNFTSSPEATSPPLSFALLSSSKAITTFPFSTESSIYSIGATTQTNSDSTSYLFNFFDGSKLTKLNELSTPTKTSPGSLQKLTLEIGIGGYWCYRINDTYLSSGVLLEGFDLEKPYHIVISGSGQDNKNQNIQSVRLETQYAAGERAKKMRGTWLGGQGDFKQMKDFKTLDTSMASFTNGAILSAEHKAPHKLFDKLTQGLKDAKGNPISMAPAWGDLSKDTPENDPYLDLVKEIKSLGFKVKAYTNCENFVGRNTDPFEIFATHWKEHCDTDPQIQAFIKSQPFHTGVWNKDKKAYIIALNKDGTEKFPNRKYMFCYAEYFLKDYSLRYGKNFDSWIFDDGGTMAENGDNPKSGNIEEQRIYQAYANAVHAGNPSIPIAFNNSRSTAKYPSFPFAHAIRVEDFTFGHAFGGNNDHANKKGSQFNSNYRHIQRMKDTNGYVHAGGQWTWDDKIVGNMHSKIGTTAWKYAPKQAWEQADFNQWNLEALQAGGTMTWDGSIPRKGPPILRTWAVELLKGLDDHLAKHQYPGAPNWARAYTILPNGKTGKPYQHVLIEEKDLWDPEGDKITSVSTEGDSPAWLKIIKDPKTPGHWLMQGTPPAKATATTYTFKLTAQDTNKMKGSREVTLTLEK